MSLSVAGMLQAGETPNLEAAIVKDLGNALEREMPELVAPGRARPARAPANDRLEPLLAEAVLHAPSFTLRGGTREILRGIIARGLGLRDERHARPRRRDAAVRRPRLARPASMRRRPAPGRRRSGRRSRRPGSSTRWSPTARRAASPDFPMRPRSCAPPAATPCRCRSPRPCWRVLRCSAAELPAPARDPRRSCRSSMTTASRSAAPATAGRSPAARAWYRGDGRRGSSWRSREIPSPGWRRARSRPAPAPTSPASHATRSSAT